jgi:hypothetical protein
MAKETIDTYKGYEIRTTPNGNGHISLIYKGDDFKGGTASDLCGNAPQNSIDKAKRKIDHLINGTYVIGQPY